MSLITRNYFKPRVFKCKIYILILLFAVDIILNSFTQFLTFGSKNAAQFYKLENFKVQGKGISLVLFVIQLLIQLMMLFTTLSLFWNTFHFQLGFVSKICKEFRFTFIVIGLYPLIFIAERIYRLIFLGKKELTHRNSISIWESEIYRIIYILKYLIGVTYYIFVLDAAYELGKSKYYKPDDEFKSNFN